MGDMELNGGPFPAHTPGPYELSERVDQELYAKGRQTHDATREEVVEEIRQALVDEINRQAMEHHPGDPTNALIRAQTAFGRLDMERLAAVALDSFQDRVALAIAVALTKLKEKADPSSVKFGGHDR